MLIKNCQSVFELETSLKEYFKEYSYLEVSLTNEVISRILITCDSENSSLKCFFNIDNEVFFNIVNKSGVVIKHEDIWQYLFINAMEHYDLVITRLLKKE